MMLIKVVSDWNAKQGFKRVGQGTHKRPCKQKQWSGDQIIISCPQGRSQRSSQSGFGLTTLYQVCALF